VAYPDDWSPLPSGFLNTTRTAAVGTEGRGEAGTHAAHHNDVASSVNAVVATIGLRPQGRYATIAERLDAIPAASWESLGSPPSTQRWGTGDDLDVYAAGAGPRFLDIRSGTAARPDTVFGPHLKLSRYMRTTEAELAAVTVGDGVQWMNTGSLQVVNAVDSEVQAVGLFLGGRTYSNLGSPGNDVCPLYVVGRSMAGATGTGFAAFLAGRRDDSAGRLTTLELHAYNNGADGIYLPTGPSATKAIWGTCAGSGQTAVFCQIGNPWGVQFRYGFTANGQIAGGKTGGISDAFLLDDSTAEVSYFGRGVHARAFILSQEGAGPVVLNAADTTLADPRRRTSALWELQAPAAASYNPVAAIVAAGTTTALTFEVANGATGVKLGVAGGRDNFLTGTIGGDITIFSTAAGRIIHAGVAGPGRRGTLRIGGDNWGWGQQPDSFGNGVGVEYLADCTTTPTSAPVNGVLRYSEGGFPRLMDSLGTVTKPGDNKAWSRTAEVATLHPDEAVTQLTLVSGTDYGATARVRTTQTYTRIRFCAGTVGSGVTDLRLGVCDTTGARIVQTPNIVARWVTNRIIEGTLETPFRGTEGQIVKLDIGSIASTAITVRGMASASDMTALVSSETGAPRAKTASGFTTGNPLGNLTSNGSNNVPWIELLP
jgi:hypothetical protein